MKRNLDKNNQAKRASIFKWIAFEIYPLCCCMFVFRFRFLFTSEFLRSAIILLNVFMAGIGVGFIVLHILQISQSIKNDPVRICISIKDTNENVYLYTDASALERLDKKELENDIPMLVSSIIKNEQESFTHDNENPKKYIDYVYDAVIEWGKIRGITFHSDSSGFDLICEI